MPKAASKGDDEIRRQNPSRSRGGGRLMSFKPNYKDPPPFNDSDEEEEDDDVDVKTERKSKRKAAASGEEEEEEEERSNSGSNPASGSSSSSEEEELEVESEEEEEEEESAKKRRRSERANGKKKETKKNETKQPAVSLRTSSRANKFTKSMAEPPSSVRDLLLAAADKSSNSNDASHSTSSSEENKAATPPKNNNKRATSKKEAAASNNNNKKSPLKSPARRHAKHRLSIRSDRPKKGDSSDDEADNDSDAIISSTSSADNSDEHEDDGEEQEPLKIQKIIACRTETRAKWREICKSIQTSEIEEGSRWNQEMSVSPEKTSSNDDDIDNDSSKVYEERFLIKWKDLSFLHCSWETQADLESQVENVKTYLNTFFRKSLNGLLFSADERCDGDYFDPAFTQIDRILEFQLPEDGDDYPTMTPEAEDSFQPHDFGIIMDKSNENYEYGTGRQFLIKWENLGYSESSYEFERDLVLSEIDYKPHVKAFLIRSSKPHRADMRDRSRKGESLRRRLYKTFGDSSPIEQSQRDKEVEKYKQDLQAEVHKNGGQLRDYQAEGVAWMISNYVNARGFILADEMGLGKTLQTATLINIITTKLHRNLPVLIIAPLSTLAHWKREFTAWTDLNVIAYYGSAEDRKLIRELEFVYEENRPKGGVAFNQTYLKKCAPKQKDDPLSSPWMAQVVITTPETMICEDSNELLSVQWEVVAVDEAHRLKNNNSKLTMKLKDANFIMNHKILLTGTPIQNNVQEFWTLLNFIDPDSFRSMDDFMDKYGDLKSKERVDELHEEIRPYILRRLKEDVEKSVPPKEEQLIEVELTISQKQYYRALYEKNVGFLYKNKKTLDGPSLNNLAMQLRKCCNHLFLLKGVELDFRASLVKAGETLSEGDLLVKASGKLVLLDKLLPRLREQGHRVLLFSQFKIMLDILEDYFRARQTKYERIDGSITGNSRQQAIDRFQAPTVDGKEPPFVMMLTTRAGGVGINLTAADTVIIFDSDFNPQSDLQAQARCHRIGQTQNVKVYRLISRKSYEMQMFHVSSMKMGLDQAVLKGFENGTSGEGALSKSEVEKLLRHGAYDIFNEEKAGTAEAESNDFVQQDIDSILERRSRTVVHNDTGSQSNAAGGTFSKASFKIAKSPGSSDAANVDEDIDIEDPDFWKKMLGDPKAEDTVVLDKASRRKFRKNYDESSALKDLDNRGWYKVDGDSSSDSSAEEEEDGGDDAERSRWGGSTSKDEWARDDAEAVVRTLTTFGYRSLPLEQFLEHASLSEPMSSNEVKRMSFSICLLSLIEAFEEEMSKAEKVLEKRSEKAAENGDVGSSPAEGAALCQLRESEKALSGDEQAKKAFEKVWNPNSSWMKHVLQDAVDHARENQPRASETIEKLLRPEQFKSQPKQESDVMSSFAQAWQSLKNRGWKAETLTTGENAGKTRYEFEGKQFFTIETVLTEASKRHPDLASMCEDILAMQTKTRMESIENSIKERADHLALSADNIGPSQVTSFLEKYAPLQLLADRIRSKHNRLRIRKVLDICGWMSVVSSLVQRADASPGDPEALKRLEASLLVDRRCTLPHPSWTSRHDAVLVHAISKHGWIDHGSTFRAIAEDANIRWGAPFELIEGPDVEPAPVAFQDIVELRATASRAAVFVSKYRELIEEYKGINQAALARTYCLIRPTTTSDDNGLEGPIQCSQSQPWVVDDSALGEQSVETTEKSGSSRHKAEDLPTSKDLHRRAKLVLTRCQVDAAPVPSLLKERASHGFAVLDQSVRSNVLLAEMLRGLVKGAKSQAKTSKRLCTAALSEANQRVNSIKDVMKRNPSQQNSVSKTLSDMEQIVQHINVVYRNLQKTVRQSKNVIRVMLGEEVDSGRNPQEELFPVETKNLNFPAIRTQKKPSAVVVSKSSLKAPQNTRTTGEVAIENAKKRLTSVVKGRECSKNSHDGASELLELTEIEIQILSVACAKGLPVWNNDWGALLAEPVRVSDKRPRPYSLTWTEFGQAVSDHAKILYALQESKVRKLEDEVAAIVESDENDKLHRRLSEAERICEMKEQAYDQAEDYAAESETLAKKTIMMIAKATQHLKLLTTSSFTSCVGDKVLNWLKADLCRWGASLDLLDESGQPFALTAMDFIDDLGEQERSSIEASAVMDTADCRGLISQVALMSRLRSVFLSCERGAKQSILESAVRTVDESPHKWDSEPSWWGTRGGVKGESTLHHDQLLLERLMHSGFDDVLENKKSYGVGGDVTAARVSFQNVNLTKQGIQSRANQLVRELHTLEASGNYYQSRENTPVKRPRMQQGRSPYMTVNSPGSGQRQHQRNSKNGEDEDEVAIVDRPRAAQAKRDDDEDSDDLCEIVDPPCLKRKSPDPLPSSESPGKRSK